MNSKKLIVMCIIVIIQNSVFSSKGSVSADFLTINADPYITSLGEGAYAIDKYNLSNPASFAFYKRNMISVSYFPWLMDDIKYYNCGMVVVTSFGNIGFAIGSLDYGEIEGYDNYQNKINLLESRDMVGVFTFSREIKSNVPVETIFGSYGVSLKFVRSQYGDYATESVAGDFGVVYKLKSIEKIPFLNNFSMGLSYRNFGSKMKYAVTENFLPESLCLGLCYNDIDRIIVVGDVNFSLRLPVVYSLGISFIPIKPLGICFGYRYSEDAVNNGLRVGFNIAVYDNLLFEYSYSPVVDFVPTHKMGIKFVFGYLSKEKMYESYLREHLDTAREYYRRGNYTMAKSIIEDIYMVFPNNMSARKLEEEIDRKTREVSLEKEKIIDSLIKKIEKNIISGNVYKAEKYYKMVFSLDPLNPVLADYNMDIEKLKQQIRQQKVIKENSAKIKKWFRTGVAYFMRGKYVNARQEFENILAISPENEEALSYMSKIDAQLGTISATQINEIFNRGVENYNRGDYQAALKYFEAVVIAAPQRTDVANYIKLCKEQIAKKEEKKQEEVVVSKQKEVQKEMVSLFNHALELYDKEAYEEAYIAFTKSLNMATTYKFENYKNESAKYMAIIRSILAEKYFKEGFRLQQQNKLEESLISYKKALNYSPSNPTVISEIEKISKILAQRYYDEGMRLYMSGEVEKAKAMLRKSLQYMEKEETKRALERIK